MKNTKSISRLHNLAVCLGELGEVLPSVPDFELRDLLGATVHIEVKGGAIQLDELLELLYRECRQVLERVRRAPPTKADQDSFDEDVRYYKGHLAELLSGYKGKYIALLNKQVVDSDTDFSRLAERVYAKFGYRDILMPKVEEPRVLNMPSPRLVSRG